MELIDKEQNKITKNENLKEKIDKNDILSVKCNSDINIKETGGITMAYLGDAVWELYVREYFIKKTLNRININKKVKLLVNARSQSKIYKKIFSELEVEYQDIGRRGRNSNIKTYPSSCTPIEYRQATGFEAIIAALYLNEKIDYIKDLVKKYAEGGI